jgi:hypothetical protein
LPVVSLRVFDKEVLCLEMHVKILIFFCVNARGLHHHWKARRNAIYIYEQTICVIFSLMHNTLIEYVSGEGVMKEGQFLAKENLRFWLQDWKGLHLVCFLLGNSPASEFYMPTFRNTLSFPSS